MKLKENSIKSKRIYKGKILDLFVDDVLLNNNKKSRREYCKHVFAVAVLLEINGKFILEKQYRYPIKKITLEIPAGKSNPKESPIGAAKREVKEETGYIIDKIKSLGIFYPAAAYSTEKIYLYYAKASKQEKQNLDEDEFLTFNKYKLNELLKLIKENKIDDAKTIIAILKYYNEYVK